MHARAAGLSGFVVFVELFAFIIFLLGQIDAGLFGYTAQQIRQTLENGRSPEPLPVVDGGIAAHDFTGSNIVGDAGLCGGDGSVADGAVAGDADLAGEDDIAADSVEPASPTWAQSSVFSPTVEPWPTWTRLSIFAPAAIGFRRWRRGRYRRWPGSRRPCRCAPGRTGGSCTRCRHRLGEAEAVATDDDSVLEDDVVAEQAVLADDGVGMGEEVASRHERPGIEDDMGQEDGAVARRTWSPYDDIGADVGVRLRCCAVGAMTAVGWMPGG